MKTVGDALDAGFTILQFCWPKHPEYHSTFAVAVLSNFSNNRRQALEGLANNCAADLFPGVVVNAAVAIRLARDDHSVERRELVLGDEIVLPWISQPPLTAA